MITEKQFKIAIITLFLLIAGILYATRNVPDEKLEIEDTFNTAIKQGHFPCADYADSVWGIDSRGTDAWCELASCNQDEEGRMYTEHGVEFYDYSINIHNDTVWLYNGDNELVTKGKFNELPILIGNDNDLDNP